MDDVRLFLTPDEAESLLLQGDRVHSFIHASIALMGADHDRANVLKEFAEADSIEVGGSACRGMRHPIVVIKGDRTIFYECDMDKLVAFETSRKQQEN